MTEHTSVHKHDPINKQKFIDDISAMISLKENLSINIEPITMPKPFDPNDFFKIDNIELITIGYDIKIRFKA